MDEIVIHHNDELGEQVFSVCLRSDFDNWIDSFYDFSHAVDLANEKLQELNLNIKIECSISKCKIRHSLTSGDADATHGITKR